MGRAAYLYLSIYLFLVPQQHDDDNNIGARAVLI